MTLKLKEKEQDICKAISDLFKARRIWFRRIHSIGLVTTKGVPDYEFWWCKHPCKMEVKSVSGKVEDEQKRYLNEWAEQGGISLVVRSSYELEDFLAIIASGVTRKLFSNQHRKDFG